MAGDNKDVAADSNEATPHRFLTFERTIELMKLFATVWIAFVGSWVTMQFNERQHELSRMEAISKMLPHVASDDNAAPSVASKPDMGRDGAIWAIFRTAKNKTMLRDLASLFPEDIYRVVSSIAVAGGLEHDQDGITALQVASEKLATRYAGDTAHAELATRLYNQAVRLKERQPNDDTPLYIVDLTTPEVESPASQDQAATLLAALNKLAALHLRDSQSSKQINTGHWQAKQLFKKARQLGANSTDKLVQMQVATADKQLGDIYAGEGHLRDALVYLQEARTLQVTAYGAQSPELAETDAEIAKVQKLVAQQQQGQSAPPSK